MQFICYPNCTTCKKARKWLEDHNLPFEFRDIKLNNPTVSELETWLKKSNLPLSRFWNTSGQQYRALNLKDKRAHMTAQEQINLLATDGMLVKRPIIIGPNFVLVGFKEAEWAGVLLS
ncbi:MAG: arsenate reductase family protein [Desulfitobacteriia bacterium]|jgi:arsenate reductase